MENLLLIDYLKKYGTITEIEKQNIEKYFIPIYVKKKQILIDKNALCNKLFFVNKGLLRAYCFSPLNNQTELYNKKCNNFVRYGTKKV